MCLWSLIAFLVCCVWFVSGFNVETYDHAVFRGRTTSMFGFSVAIHKAFNKGWFIVGAPEGQSEFQPMVNTSGVVHKCDVTQDGLCQTIPFDRYGPYMNSENGKPWDTKDHQWFGATVSASGTPNGKIVACAPRYVWFATHQNRRDPVGTCWVTDGGFREFNEYSPCRAGNRWGYHRQGSCQAGFSAAIDKTGDVLFMGAPGSFYWQGQMISIDAKERYPYKPALFQTFGVPLPRGDVHRQSLLNRTYVYSSAPGSEDDDDSYMGYSTVVGDFNGSGKQGIAVGMPRGHSLKGKVLLFTWDLSNYKNFSSSQIGSYFGYALATSDVDGDGLTDLIIGAPMHTRDNQDKKYDVGRVYVIFQKNSFTSPPHIIEGKNSRARFGQALTTLGDMNQDGFGDFAVGAPYDGKSGRGAVYIYHGSAQGVREKASQVIYGEEMQRLHGFPVSTFGFSVSGGLDLDGNEYPDMGVGAYNSDTAFFFRARPVVKVDAYVEYDVPNKIIDLNKTNCEDPNDPTKEVVCVTINFCIKYSGKKIPNKLTFELEYILDDGLSNKKPRMLFIPQNSSAFNETVVLSKDNQDKCLSKHAYIKSDVRNKLALLDAEVKYWLKDYDATVVTHKRRRNVNSELYPVIDLNNPPSKKDSLSIQKNCGEDNQCIPELEIKASKTVIDYLLGSSDPLTIKIIVKNFGEDSYETVVNVVHSKSLQFIGRDIITAPTGVHCETLEHNRTFVYCEIGNPLPAQKVVEFDLRFKEETTDKAISPTFEFHMYVNSSNPEESYTTSNNEAYLRIDALVEANLYLRGVSAPKSNYYEPSVELPENITKASDMGPPVTYFYYLTNRGPSEVNKTEVFFLWPYQTLDGQDLLYLAQKPQYMPKHKIMCDNITADKDNYRFPEFQRPNEFLRLDMSITPLETESSGDINVEAGRGKSGIAGGQLDEENGDIGAVTGDSSFDLQDRHRVSNTGTGGSRSSSHRPIIPHKIEIPRYSYSQKFENGEPVLVTTIRNEYGRTESQYQLTLDPQKLFINGSGGGWTVYGGSREPVTGHGSTKIVQGTYPGDRPSGSNELNFSWDSKNRKEQSSTGGSSTHYQQRFRTDNQYGTPDDASENYQRVSHHKATQGSDGAQHNTHGGFVQTYSAGGTSTGGSFQNRLGAVDIATAERGHQQYQQQRGYGRDEVRQQVYRAGDVNRNGWFDQHGVYHEASEASSSSSMGGIHVAGGQELKNYKFDLNNGDHIDVTEGNLRTLNQPYYHGQGGSRGRTESSYRYESRSESRTGPDGVRHESKSESRMGPDGVRHEYHTERTFRMEENYVESNDPRARHYRRTKRQDTPETNPYVQIMKALPCRSTKCLYMRCTVYNLQVNEEVGFALIGRVNLHTIKKISVSQPVTVSTAMSARIVELPHIGSLTKGDLLTQEVETKIEPKQPIKKETVPLWVVVLSAVAGTLILLLLILLLYKIGFFKRNRPSNAPERQPLNRNGYHHGDEAL